MAIQWMALCVAAAMICALLRVQRPELATVISLAAGVAVVVTLCMRLRADMPQMDVLERALRSVDPDIRSAVVRGCGIAVIADLGTQLCRDAGETALAGRVALIARFAILALCVPLLSELAALLGQLSG